LPQAVHKEKKHHSTIEKKNITVPDITVSDICAMLSSVKKRSIRDVKDDTDSNIQQMEKTIR
jgi:hypothetical protein